MTNKKRGFTVVELVIVIAVIGILSAILIPTFSGLVAKANAQQKQLDLRHAYVAYTTDEGVGENVLAEDEVYLIEVEGFTTFEAGVTKAWTYDKTTGIWTNGVTSNGNYAVEKAGGESAKDFNGYYLYYVVVA